MSASLRFLGLAVAGWAVLRAFTLGILPGAEVFTVVRAQPVPAAQAGFSPRWKCPR